MCELKVGSWKLKIIPLRPVGPGYNMLQAYGCHIESSIVCCQHVGHVAALVNKFNVEGDFSRYRLIWTATPLCMTCKAHIQPIVFFKYEFFVD